MFYVAAVLVVVWITSYICYKHYLTRLQKIAVRKHLSISHEIPGSNRWSLHYFTSFLSEVDFFLAVGGKAVKDKQFNAVKNKARFFFIGHVSVSILFLLYVTANYILR
jgi:hypothetical protein